MTHVRDWDLTGSQPPVNHLHLGGPLSGLLQRYLQKGAETQAGSNRTASQSLWDCAAEV